MNKRGKIEEGQMSNMAVLHLHLWWYYDKANDNTNNENQKLGTKIMSYGLELPSCWYDDS